MKSLLVWLYVSFIILPGLVGILLARAANTIFITGTRLDQNSVIIGVSCVFFMASVFIFFKFMTRDYLQRLVNNTVLHSIADKGDEVLENCAKNVNLNAGNFHPKASVHVRELDWNHPWPPATVGDAPSEQR